MSPSFAILLGIFIGAIAGALLGVFLAAGKTKTEQRLREQAELSAREQLAALQKEIDRGRAESEARSYQASQSIQAIAGNVNKSRRWISKECNDFGAGDTFYQSLCSKQ